MKHYFLFLLTLNPQTGQFTKAELVNDRYGTELECLRAALEKGPQTTTGDGAKVHACRLDVAERVAGQ